VEAAFWDYINDKKDLNTALRESQEAIGKVIDADLSK
jgi:hypothetical protein